MSGGIYCGSGLDADEISEFVAGGKLLKDYNKDGVSHISNEELLVCDCDILVPAALENQINAEVAEKLKCKYVVEGANGPTTAEADEILDKRVVTLIPDIFANSGGVTVSYFEWVQNIQELTWSRDEVNQMLEKLMTESFECILEEKKKSNCSYRMAAYIVALRRLLYAHDIKGLFP